LQVAFGAPVGCDGLFYGRIAGNWRVEADVLLEGREIDQNAVLLKCRHFVADDFFGFRSGFADRRSDGLENRLNFSRIGLNVLVDVAEVWDSDIHQFPPECWRCGVRLPAPMIRRSSAHWLSTSLNFIQSPLGVFGTANEAATLVNSASA
jgi:hypothetical protein